jgi:hypothetical protein
VVVTSAGGETFTAAGGSYQLHVRVPFDAQSVQVTAVGARATWSRARPSG